MATLVSRPSASSEPSPGYMPHDVELARLDSSSSPSLLSAPPPYDDAPANPSAFHPTVHFQIETRGKRWLSFPSPTRPDPIPVFALHPSDSSACASTSLTTPAYISHRPERSSGSCYLTTPLSPTTPLATTTYRFGPGRPARMRLFHPASTSSLTPSTLQALLSSKDEETPSVEPWDDFPLTSLGLLTRALAFRTRLGTFEWRYASRRERAALSPPDTVVSSLLVLERVVRVATAGRKKDEEIRTPVAQLIRGEGYRADGSGASDAGNGGRLVLDLGMWEDEDQKGEREMVQVLAVATCLVMLKREVDRRRAQQMAIIAGAVSGGS